MKCNDRALLEKLLWLKGRADQRRDVQRAARLRVQTAPPPRPLPSSLPTHEPGAPREPVVPQAVAGDPGPDGAIPLPLWLAHAGLAAAPPPSSLDEVA